MELVAVEISNDQPMVPFKLDSNQSVWIDYSYRVYYKAAFFLICFGFGQLGTMNRIESYREFIKVTLWPKQDRI